MEKINNGSHLFPSLWSTQMHSFNKFARNIRDIRIVIYRNPLHSVPLRVPDEQFTTQYKQNTSTT